MSGLISQKKELKRKKLLDSSYDLFIQYGISNVSIAQICEKAGIAKGTFYLYFESKEDIVRALNRRISFTILQKAYDIVNNNRKETFIENLITMANYVIDYFAEDQETLLIMKKDFIFPFNQDDFEKSENPLMKSLHNEILKYSETAAIPFHDVLFRMYSLLSMIISVCYSVFIDSFPNNDIENLKPILFEMIEKAMK